MQLEFSHRAKHDLDAILGYIAMESGNDSALRVGKRIVRSVRKFAQRRAWVNVNLTVLT
jgi:plasmid stabilization system protein ParE